MVSRGEWYQVTEKGKYKGGDKSWIKAVELKAKVSGQPLATLLGAAAHLTGLSPTALQKQHTEPKAIAKKSKGVGAQSILQKAGKLSKSKKEKLVAATRKQKKGDFGWRTLAVKMSETLNVEVRGHETARRTSILLTQHL